MGSRNKVLLASLVSMVMMLSFAIGLVPAAIDNSLTGASAAAPAVAITADGATPAGDSLTLSVGESIRFSALGADAGVDWSLASDGSAELIDASGGATVVARAPGEAGLYLSSASGVDLVNLTVVAAAENKQLSEVTIVAPADDSTVYIQAGAASAVPYRVKSRTNDPGATDEVSYELNGEELGASTRAPDFPVIISDIRQFITGEAAFNTLAATAAAYSAYSDFRVIEGEFDEDGNALPDNPFLLNLQRGDSWVASQDGTTRQVMIVPLVDNFADKQLFDIDGDGATASLAHPGNEEQVVTAFAPAGLIEVGVEIGYLVLVVADTLEDLLDNDGALPANLLAFPGDGINGARFADVSIIVSDDDGDTFFEIGVEEPLANPVVIWMEGIEAAANDPIRMFSYQSDVLGADPGIIIVAPEGAAWAGIADREVGDGIIKASTSNLSVFAPFSIEGGVFIESVSNATPDSLLLGTAQARATGGDAIEIAVANADPGASATVSIDGQPVSIQGQFTDGGNVVYQVTAPSPVSPAGASGSASVPVIVTIGAEADQSSLTYVGPTLTSIEPAFGPESGGTPVVINGGGLTGSTVTIGGNTLNGAKTAGQVAGNTPAGSAGIAEVRAEYANGYFGTLEGGFFYTSTPPTISVNPMVVFDDGGYTVRVTADENGGRFVDPETGVLNEIYFTQEEFANPASETDIPAQAVNFIDDRRLDVITPDVSDLNKQAAALKQYTLFNVYWTTSAYSGSLSKQDSDFVSNFVEGFTFVDKDAAAYTINNINPNRGEAEGGESVVISGDFGGLEDEFVEGPPPPPEPEGRQSFFGAVFVEPGQEIEFAPQSIPAEPGSRFELTIYHSVAEPVDTTPPASLTFTVTWDPAVLSVPNPNPVEGFNPASRSQLLIDYYNKGIDVNFGQRAQGRLPIVLSGGSTFTPEFTTVSTSITTCNNQLPVIDEDACPGQQNPFPLVTIVFDVVGGDGSSSAVFLDEYAGADRNGAPTGTAQDALGTTVVIGGGTKQGADDFTVFFGTQGAAVEQAGFLPSDPDTDAIEVIAPPVEADAAAAAFEQGDDFSVDVRVEGPDFPGDPTQFALEAGGYTYEGDFRQISNISPTSAWLFGSENMTISGTNFPEGSEDVTVTFTLNNITDGEGGPIVLTADIQGEVESDTIVVSIPALVVDGEPIEVPTRTTTATVSVDFGDEEEPLDAPQNFTYVKWDVTGTEATGQVTTNAFIFAADQPFSPGEDGFIFDGPAEQAKGWTDQLVDFPTATTGILTIPALPPAVLDTKGTDGLVFGILRVTRTGELFGISQTPPNSDPFPGDEIEGIFNFDLHLYQGEDLAEFYVEYDATEASDPDDLPSILYNVEGTDLSRELIATGGVATWSRPTTFDFTFSNRSLSIPPVPDQDKRTLAPRPNTYALEALLVTEDTAGTDTEVLAVRTRLQNLGAGSFALRSGQAPPRDLVEALLGQTGADRTITPTGGDRGLVVSGRYIYWATELFIVLEGQDPTAENSTPIEDRFRGEDGRDNLVATAPDLDRGTYDLYIQLPAVGGKQTDPILVEGQLIVSDERPRPDLSGLLGLLGTILAAIVGGGVALLGLLAGGDSSSSGGPCFIATAAYGSPMATEIEVLRTFRDSFLLSNPLGSAFVDVYYRVSPALADVVAQSPVLAAVTRLLLLPVILAGKMLVSMPFVSIGLLSLSLALATVRRRFSRGM